MQVNLMSESFLVASAFEQIGWALLHFSWQGTAVAMFAFVLLWFMKNHTAASRYIVGLTCMVVMVACPIVTFTVLTANQASDSAMSSAFVKATPELPASSSAMVAAESTTSEI